MIIYLIIAFSFMLFLSPHEVQINKNKIEGLLKLFAIILLGLAWPLIVFLIIISDICE